MWLWGIAHNISPEKVSPSEHMTLMEMGTQELCRFIVTDSQSKKSGSLTYDQCGEVGMYIKLAEHYSNVTITLLLKT
jgi:hypothetical protein